MDIRVSESNGVTIVQLAGNFDIASSKPFDDEINALADAGNKKVILDFSNVGFIASTGLRVLLKAAQRLKSDNGALYLCCANETVSEVFAVTGFDTILSIYATREEALDAMPSSATQ